jgi:hypothetical protein
MNQQSSNYPHYIDGAVLPKGVFPPLKGYSHKDLIRIPSANLYKLLIDENIKQTLVKEIVFNIVSKITLKYEELFTECESLRPEGRSFFCFS